jgi:glutamate racemase
VLQAAQWLAGQGIAALLVACNTATSVTIEELRRRFAFPVIGMEPAVKPAVAGANEAGRNRRVLVAATPLTLREEKFSRLVAAVDQDGIVDCLPLPELVDYAERAEFRSDVIGDYLRQRTARLDLAAYGTLVLGCTHFLYFLPHFRRLFPAPLDIIDGNEGTVRQLERELARLPGHDRTGRGGAAFFESGRPVGDAGRFLQFMRQYEAAR